MKGIISACITFTLIYTCLCECRIYNGTNYTLALDGDKINACRQAYLDDSNLENGQTHCCLFIVGNGDYNQCGPLTDDQYRNIKDYRKYLNEFVYGNLDIKKIRCGSNYLSYSLFVISILALIF